MIDGARCPDIIKKCKPLVQKAYETNQRGTIMEDMRMFERSVHSELKADAPQVYDERKARELDPEIRNAVRDMQLRGSLNVRSTDKAIHHQHATINGLRYRGSPRSKELVFIRSNDGHDWLPATIRQIFSLPATDGTAITLLAIHRLTKAPANVKDPFLRWKDFGAVLWGEESRSMDIIAATDDICPGNKRAWRECWVVRPLDKVSRYRLSSYGC